MKHAFQMFLNILKANISNVLVISHDIKKIILALSVPVRIFNMWCILI